MKKKWKGAMYPWSKKKCNPRPTRDPDSEEDLSELKESLKEFRSSVLAAAERPAFFWKAQQNAIKTRMHEPPGMRRRILLWAPAALAILMCLFFFVENSKAPTPDLAAGADQNLLIDVERALNQDCPDALAPAALLGNEIERARNSGE